MADQCSYTVQPVDEGFRFNVIPARISAHPGIITMAIFIAAIIGAVAGGGLGAFFGVLCAVAYIFGVMSFRNISRGPYDFLLNTKGIILPNTKNLDRNEISNFAVKNRILKTKYLNQSNSSFQNGVVLAVSPGVGGAAALAAHGAFNISNQMLNSATHAQNEREVSRAFRMVANCRGKEVVVADNLTEDTAIALMNETSNLAVATWT